MTDPITIGVIIAVITIVGFTWNHLTKSPNVQRAELERRVKELEVETAALKLHVREKNGVHDYALNQLTAAVTKLTDRFDAYMGARNG